MPPTPNPYEQDAQEAAKLFNIDPALLNAVASSESSWNPNAVGPLVQGGRARGLMQLMPGTGHDMGLSEQDFMNPRKNLFAGARYLSKMGQAAGGDPYNTAVAYHAGAGNLEAFKQNPMQFPQTKMYADRVRGKMGIAAPNFAQGQSMMGTGPPSGDFQGGEGGPEQPPPYSGSVVARLLAPRNPELQQVIDEQRGQFKSVAGNRPPTSQLQQEATANYDEMNPQPQTTMPQKPGRAQRGFAMVGDALQGIGQVYQSTHPRSVSNPVQPANFTQKMMGDYEQEMGAAQQRQDEATRTHNIVRSQMVGSEVNQQNEKWDRREEKYDDFEMDLIKIASENEGKNTELLAKHGIFGDEDTIGTLSLVAAGYADNPEQGRKVLGVILQGQLGVTDKDVRDGLVEGILFGGAEKVTKKNYMDHTGFAAEQGGLEREQRVQFAKNIAAKYGVALSPEMFLKINQDAEKRVPKIVIDLVWQYGRDGHMPSPEERAGLWSQAYQQSLDDMIRPMAAGGGQATPPPGTEPPPQAAPAPTPSGAPGGGPPGAGAPTAQANSNVDPDIIEVAMGRPGKRGADPHYILPRGGTRQEWAINHLFKTFPELQDAVAHLAQQFNLPEDDPKVVQAAIKTWYLHQKGGGNAGE